MFTPFFTITPKITKDIETIGTIFGYFDAVSLPKNYRKEYVSKITAEIVHASTAIEGNTLTEKQVREVLQGKKIPAQEIDIKEVQNYNKALSFIEFIEINEKFTFTEALIKKINGIILKGIKDNIAGKYRLKQVIVGDYLPPEYYKVPLLMREFVQWANNPQPENLSPILYTGIGHYQLVAIHPFEDGNGRATRILTTLMLIKYGYDMTSFFALESYYNRNRKAYYEALNSADKYRINHQPDLTRWLEYYTKGMLIEAERAKSRIEEIMEKNKSLKGKAWLSDTQVKILQLTIKKETVKIADYLKISNLSRKGTYNALEKLVRLGLIKRIGEKKGAYYMIKEKGLDYIR